MFLFLGFTGLHNLQSSLHREGGLGVINLAVLYGTYAVCGLFLGSIIVGRLGWKWSMVVAELGYVLWMAANLYAVWATLIPAAAITGLAASILWTAHGPYIAECGILLGNFEGHTRSSAIALLTGVDMALHSMGMYHKRIPFLHTPLHMLCLFYSFFLPFSSSSLSSLSTFLCIILLSFTRCKKKTGY